MDATALNLKFIPTIRATLEEQGIKAEDIPDFNNDSISWFFFELYSTYPEASDEALWQAVSDSTRVAYSRKKPNGSYTRTVTTIGRWLKRIDHTLSDSDTKTYSDRYHALQTDTSGLILEVCQGADDIVRVYADDTICDSCMSGSSEVRVYDSPDIHVVYATHDGVVVGRAVCNRWTKRFVRAYPNGDEGKTHGGLDSREWRGRFLALLEREGYVRDTECLLNCRLKYIGGVRENGCTTDTQLYMPFIDGEYHHVSWDDGEEFAVITDDTEGTYECDRIGGLSEVRHGIYREGHVLIGDEWYPMSRVKYSRYNDGYILSQYAHYSRYDNDYFWLTQVVNVTLFDYDGNSREGVDGLAHTSNYLIDVIGLERPVLCAELPYWERAGLVYHYNGIYYHSDYQTNA